MTGNASRQPVPSGPTPPRFARLLLALLLPARLRRHQIGDLDDEFQLRIGGGDHMAGNERDIASARRWYRRQVARSLAPAIACRVRELRPQKSVGGSQLPHGPTRARSAFFEGLRGDVLFGLRSLRKSPGFTAVALATLALGIGANTAVFSVIDAVLLEDLPYREPDRLFMVWRYDTPSNVSKNFSSPDIRDIAAQANTFAALSAYNPLSVTIATNEQGRRVPAAQVTDSFLDVMAVSPLIGRGINASDLAPGGERVVVLGHSFWERELGADPEIVGTTVHIDSRRHTVVGVMPAGFSFPPRAELWMPLPPDEYRNGHWLTAVGRLATGVEPEQAQVEVGGIIGRLEEEYPNRYVNNSARLVPLREQFSGPLRPTLIVLSVAVGAVLLIGCANVANLLMARSSARRREIAVRTALGASRSRVVRQLLTESVTLACAGGALGLLLAFWSTDLLLTLAPPEVPRLTATHVDLGLLGFSFGLALVTGLLFGLAPAMRVAAVDLQGDLKQQGRGASAGRMATSGRSALVVAEVALAVVLLVGAGLMVRTMTRLLAVDLGFVADNVWTLDVQMPVDWSSATVDIEAEDARIVNFFRDLQHRVAAIPGVESTGQVGFLPFSGAFSRTRIHVDGQAVRPRPERDLARWNAVSPGYLDTLGIPLVRGRLFTDSDDAAAEPVALINGTLARRLWPDSDPIGARITNQEPDTTSWLTVIGVVGDIKNRGLMAEPQGAVYQVHSQLPFEAMTLVVKAPGDVAPVAAGIRAAVSSLDPDLTIADVRLLSSFVDRSRAQTRFLMTLLTVFSGLAITLAAIGMYGVISYGVSQRLHELGVRMALGASARDLLQLITTGGASLASVGVAVGLLGAWAVTRLMGSLLFDVSPSDPYTFTAVATLTMLIALAACLIPAARAARIDPVEALRRG